MIHPHNLTPAQVLAKNNARSFTYQLGKHYEYIALESNGPRLSYVSWDQVSLLIYRINGSRTLLFPGPHTGPSSSFDSAADKFGRWTIHSLGIAVKFAENVPGYYIYNCKVCGTILLPTAHA
ncbi:hypothetical protein F5X99DRAFT_390246 [Biscogniauxia marginata]|nr:hypothetical protein F5X99DRAFT_390246 [Biscogniauxia marginata]